MALEKTASFLSVFALVCGQAAPHGSDTPLLSSPRISPAAFTRTLLSGYLLITL